jgi:aminoglycoside phosphotransferase (APT) family kinase protein
MESERDNPWPLEADDLTAFLDRSRAGEEFRTSFEELLCALPLVRAENLMLLIRQGRCAWLPLLRTHRGRALIIGNAFSGTGTGLAYAGWDVVLRDTHSERLAFAEARAKGLELTLGFELSDGRRRLPHADASFDLVVRDGPDGASVRELARISRGEVVLIADNRYGYKRSTGVHGEFRVRHPLEYLKSLFSSTGHSLAEHATSLKRAGLVGLRPHALYPDSRDFTFCVALSDTGPTLPLGPKERANRIKMLAHKLGLFPHLTPSYALIAHKPRARLDRPLAATLLGEALGRSPSDAPPVEHLVNTRGNNILLLAAGPRPIVLHLPMEKRQQVQVKLHLATLTDVAAHFPEVPVPRSLGAIMIDGLWYAAEERLPGLTAGQICGDHPRIARMLGEVAQQLSTMITRPPQPFTEHDCERLIAARVRRVAGKAVEPRTIEALQQMEHDARATLVGQTFPLVRTHGDLRSKHVQVTPEGQVLGYLDWGSTTEQDLPLFDLLHLLIHERKQEADLTTGQAWHLLDDDHAGIRPHEQAALDSYIQALNLPLPITAAIEALYPLLVADVAESNWDYSRPRWVHRQFGL